MKRSAYATNDATTTRRGPRRCRSRCVERDGGMSAVAVFRVVAECPWYSGVLLHPTRRAQPFHAGFVPDEREKLLPDASIVTDQTHSLELVAEGEGFEPPVEFPPQWFSRPPPSTTRPSLRIELLAKIRAVFANRGRITLPV